MRLGAVAAVATCALAGCASGDGLLIEVDLDPGLDPARVDAIKVWVGEPTASPHRFARLASPADARPVDAWPYQILILPEDAPRMVWVGAFGFPDRTAIGGAPSAEGTIDAPVEVVPGELRYATITLGPTFARDANCLFAPGPDGTGITIIPGDVPIDDAMALAGLDCDEDGDPADCDDLNPAVNTRAPELCDAIDNNCNGGCDEGFDDDADLYSRCDYAGCGAPACADGSNPPAGLIGSCDCDDSDAQAFPGGVESATCDGVDSDCDPATNGMAIGPEAPGNQIDDDCDGTCDLDLDGDLIATNDPNDATTTGTWSATCDPAIADCDDADPEVYPNALEKCDGLDTNCNGLPDLSNGGPCFVHDLGGNCTLGTRTCLEASGDMTWGPCAPGTLIVDDGACSEWAAYATTPWPEQTLYDMRADDERETCTLSVWREPDPSGGPPLNALCEASPRVRLDTPFGGSTMCQSTIAGGLERGGWHVALVPRGVTGANPAATVASCDVDLVIQDIAGLGEPSVRLPSVWVTIVQVKTDTGIPEADGVPVELRPVYADAFTSFACPAGRSLHCD